MLIILLLIVIQFLLVHLFFFELSESLLILNDLSLHLVLLRYSIQILFLLALVLVSLNLRVLSLLLLRHVNGCLDLRFLVLSLLPHVIILVLSLTNLRLLILDGVNLRVDFLLVSLFQSLDFLRSLLGLLDLLESSHLLLFKKGDSISQQLSISLNPSMGWVHK